MIQLSTIEEAMYEAIRLAVTRVPPDVTEGLEEARRAETDPIAISHLETSKENARLAESGTGLVCADTGFPLFYIRAGRDTQIEAGFEALSQAARKAVEKATRENYLRPTMVDPLSRDNPGDNIGPAMPDIHLEFAGDGDGLEIVSVPKGGGSEIFGTFYRMLYPADGVTGIKKFVLDSIYSSCYAGKVCPPAIVGIGIGGTADICMRNAKKAAVVTRLGRKHPDESIARLESELLGATRKLGIGPMGSRGAYSVLGLHIKTAMTHTAALPVAVNAQCSIGRRWTALVAADGTIGYTGEIGVW